jgi:hypothetical protein
MTTSAELVAAARGRVEELDPQDFAAEAAQPVANEVPSPY